MSAQERSLLVIRSNKSLPLETIQLLEEYVKNAVKDQNISVLITDKDFDVSLHSDLRPLIEQQLRAQQETNQLLRDLVDAMAAIDDEEVRSEPTTYLDGSPIEAISDVGFIHSGGTGNIGRS